MLATKHHRRLTHRKTAAWSLRKNKRWNFSSLNPVAQLRFPPSHLSPIACKRGSCSLHEPRSKDEVPAKPCRHKIYPLATCSRKITILSLTRLLRRLHPHRSEGPFRYTVHLYNLCKNTRLRRHRFRERTLHLLVVSQQDRFIDSAGDLFNPMFK